MTDPRSGLVARGLVKSYATPRSEPVRAVAGIDLDVEPGHLYTLLGPSGCGKTTTLRCIAGLERPDQGVIHLGDRVLYSSEERINVPANRRGLGMVFQSYAIWPHLDVFENVAFPLRVGPRAQRPSSSALLGRVERVLEVVQLHALARRPATALSGGQQQRLALARALVLEPPLLLLDEPLSNLDAQLREEMRFELKRLQRELGITSIYVTHDQVEALALADRVAVMRDGLVEQVGRPKEIYEQPATEFVAGFIGTTNFVEGRVRTSTTATGTLCVETSHGTLEVPSLAHPPSGTSVVLSVRPEHIAIEPHSGSSNGSGAWTGRVLTQAFAGDAVDHVVQVGELRMRVRCASSGSVPPGTEVSLSVDASRAVVIPIGA